MFSEDFIRFVREIVKERELGLTTIFDAWRKKCLELGKQRFSGTLDDIQDNFDLLEEEHYDQHGP